MKYDNGAPFSKGSPNLSYLKPPLHPHTRQQHHQYDGHKPHSISSIFEPTPKPKPAIKSIQTHTTSLPPPPHNSARSISIHSPPGLRSPRQTSRDPRDPDARYHALRHRNTNGPESHHTLPSTNPARNQRRSPSEQKSRSKTTPSLLSRPLRATALPPAPPPGPGAIPQRAGIRSPPGKLELHLRGLRVLRLPSPSRLLIRPCIRVRVSDIPRPRVRGCYGARRRARGRNE